MHPAILGLAQLAPAIMGLFSKSESANKAAEVVSSVAKAVTGAPTEDAALQALKADPAKLLEYQNAVNAQALSLYQEETKRLEAVNETIRAEAASGDAYVRRWRPTFGYCVALTWVTLMVACSYVIVTDPAQAGTVIAAMGSLSAMWGIALAVLGVAVHERSKDKQVAAGQTPPAGPLAALGALLTRK
jgi:hypothetical protein